MFPSSLPIITAFENQVHIGWPGSPLHVYVENEAIHAAMQLPASRFTSKTRIGYVWHHLDEILRVAEQKFGNGKLTVLIEAGEI